MSTDLLAAVERFETQSYRLKAIVARSYNDGLVEKVRAEYETARADLLAIAQGWREPAKLQISIDAYKAENAKHGWTGRGYGFEPFFMNLNKDGDATIGFNETDANWEQDDESGKQYIYCHVPVSELVALRDFLSEALPPTPGVEVGAGKTGMAG